MKNKVFKIAVSFIAAGMLHANLSMAAFPIKQESVKTETSIATLSSNSIENASSLTQDTRMQKQELKKSHNKKAGSSAIPQVLYIIMAIFWLGWLAMGINDNFSGYDWLISLLLYFLFWLPGFIFTLIKMGKYY